MQHPHCSHCACLRAKAVWASLWRFYMSVRYKLTCLFLQLFSALLTRPKSPDLRQFTSRARKSNPTAPKQNGAKYLLQASSFCLPFPSRAGGLSRSPQGPGVCAGARGGRGPLDGRRRLLSATLAGGRGPGALGPLGAAPRVLCCRRRVFVESPPSLCLRSPKYLLGVPVAATGSVSHDNQHLLIW